MDILRAAQSGEAQSVQDLVEHLAPYIRMTVRRRLPRLLRRRFDSEDFVQAVWSSFLTDEGLLDKFAEVQDLRRYLGGAAANKVLMAIRSHIETEARNMKLEVSFDEARSSEDRNNTAEPVSNSPGPASEVMASDLRSTRIAKLPRQVQELLRLKEEGHTNEQVAQELGISKRSVERGLAKLREVLG